MTTPTTPKPRGLAAVPIERRREIARMGGKASAGGFKDPEITRAASLKGVEARRAKRMAKKPLDAG